MSIRVLSRAAGSLLLASMLPVSAQALEQGDQMFRLGLTTMQPNPGGDDIELELGGGGETGELDMNSDSRPSLAFVHMLRDDVALELMGSLPFEHRLHVDEQGSGDRYSFGTLDMQQFSVSFQYYFDRFGDFRPYAGFGLHRTSFSSERIDRDATQGNTDIVGFSVESTSSWLLQLGVNYSLGGDWFLNADVRHQDMSPDVTMRYEDGAAQDSDDFELELDPLVWTLGVGRKF